MIAGIAAGRTRRSPCRAALRAAQGGPAAVLVAALTLCIACDSGAADQAAAWWTTHALIKVRPTTAPEAGREIELRAARNEFEAGQLVIQGGAAGLRGVDVEVSDLRHAQGATLPSGRIQVYLERYLELAQASSVEGGTGPWPDPLVPRRDAYRDERRNAFPFDVAAGAIQPLWIEVYVPPDLPAGRYSGQVTVLVRGAAWASVPIAVEVWGFALPSTSSLPTTFGFSGIAALREHYGSYTSDDDLRQLTELYSRAALLHRLSLHGGTMISPPFTRRGDEGEIQWKDYDAEVGPFLDGTVLGGDDPLPGARATSIDLRNPPGLTGDDLVAYWAAWARHFRARGWFDRLFHYVLDEPDEAALEKVVARAGLARRAEAGVRNLVTAPLHPTLAPVIDLWSPIINCFEQKDGERFCNLPPVPREGYDEELARGKQLWWYQSCGSHGCNVVGGDYFRGWPSYVIDVEPVAHRMMEWLTWHYRVQGELYYSIDEAFGRGGAGPWTSVHLHGGNGDGTLVYPGKPEVIGGSSHIPVESIRLKLIREGLEDYEYFTALAAKGAGDFVRERVARIVTNAYRWQRDPALLYAVRRELGEELDRRSR